MSYRTSPVIERYHELLASGRFPDTAERLQTGVARGGLIYGDRPVSRVLRPCFVDGAIFDDAMRAGTAVTRALARLKERVVSDAALRREFALPEEIEPLLLLESPQATDLSGRLDGLVSANGSIGFMEYNSMGAGMVFNDALTTLFEELPIMQELRREFVLQDVPAVQRLIGALAEGLARLLPSASVTRLTVAIVLSHSQATAAGESAESNRLTDTAAQMGIRVLGVPADELTFEGGRLRAGDQAIDVVFVDFWPTFLDIAKRDHAVWRAIEARAVWAGKSFAMHRIAGDKQSFAFLSDERYRSIFGDELFAAIRPHIPWTRRLRDERTTWHGEEIDLVRFVRRQQQQLVLKPATAHGGKGVVLGWEVDAAAWERALDAALGPTLHVVQERLIAPREQFPVAVGDRIEMEECYVDLDPFVWNEREARGAIVRVSNNSLMNVSVGNGSATPTFIVRPRSQG